MNKVDPRIVAGITPTQNSILDQVALQKYYVNVKEFGAKGDGVTDDTKAIQDAIDYAYSNEFLNVKIPFSKSGYRISGTIELSQAITLSGDNARLIADSSTYMKAVVSIRDTQNKAGNIKIEGITGITNPSNTLRFIQVGQFGKNLTIKDVEAEGFNYFLKIDPVSLPAVDVLTLKNLTIKDTVMGFLMANINRLVGESIYSTLRNSTKLDHHYYFLKNMKEISLKIIRADEGKGSVFQFNDSPLNDQEKPGVFTAEDVRCKNIERLMSTTMDLKKVELKNVYIESFKDDATEQPIYIGGAVSKALIQISDFYFAPCLPVIASAVKSVTLDSVAIRFINGKFERIKGETSISNISEVLYRNVEYANVLFDNLGANNLPVWFRVVANTSLVKVVAQNVILHVNAAFVPTLSNFHFVRLAGETDMSLDNVIVTTSDKSITDTKGFFLSKPDNLPNTSIRISNSDIRTMGAFDFGSGSVSSYRKLNTYLKNTMVT